MLFRHVGTTPREIHPSHCFCLHLYQHEMQNASASNSFKIIFTHFRSKSSCPTGSRLLSFLVGRKPSGSHRKPRLCFFLAAASTPSTSTIRKMTTDTPTRYGKTGVSRAAGPVSGGCAEKPTYHLVCLLVTLICSNGINRKAYSKSFLLTFFFIISFCPMEVERNCWTSKSKHI